MLQYKCRLPHSPRVASIPDKGKCLRKGQAQINYPEAISTRYGCGCAEGIFCILSSRALSYCSTVLGTNKNKAGFAAKVLFFLCTLTVYCSHFSVGLMHRLDIVPIQKNAG